MSNSNIYQYTLPIDDNISYSLGVGAISSVSFSFSSNGRELSILDNYSKIYTHFLEESFNLLSAQYKLTTFSIKGKDTQPIDLIFNSDGSKMYLLGKNSASVFQYSLARAYDTSIAIDDNILYDFSDQEDTPHTINFNSDGSKLFVLGISNRTIYQYLLLTPYDISTMAYDSTFFLATTEDSLPYGFAFNSDGMLLYVIGDTTDTIYQYDLISPYNLTNPTYSGKLYYYGSDDQRISDITFGANGKKMILLGFRSNGIFQYSLSSSFDISTTSMESNFISTINLDFSTTGLTSNSEGTKLYVIGSVTQRISEYDLGQGGSPEYRLCADPLCQTVILDWTTQNSKIVNNSNYIQLRLNSASLQSRICEAEVRVGGNKLFSNRKVTTVP